jgi:hypothetical protein
MALGIGRALQALGNTLFSRVLPLMTKPARELSPEEAFNLLIYLVIKGELDLVDPLRTGPEGDIISHKPGKQLKVRTTIAGVDFHQAAEHNPGRNGSVNARKTPYFQPTPEFAIVLYRLALSLRDNWGATRIVWGGIGAGSGKHSLDCHMIGTCVDFYGVTTQQRAFDVREDWFLRTVYKQDGKKHPMVSDDNDRWGNDTHTFYRLALSTDPQDDLARDFFQDVYQFISEECAFGPFDIPPSGFQSGAPMGPGYTIHPDYPGINLRRHHNDHMHFQLGQAVMIK